MANRDIIRIGWGSASFVAIEYNDANNQVRRVHVNIEAGRTVRALVWNTDTGGNPSDPATAVVDRTFVGPLVEGINVPGNLRLIERTDEAGTYLDLPDNIVYQFLERMSG